MWPIRICDGNPTIISNGFIRTRFCGSKSVNNWSSDSFLANCAHALWLKQVFCVSYELRVALSPLPSNALLLQVTATFRWRCGRCCSMFALNFPQFKCNVWAIRLRCVAFATAGRLKFALKWCLMCTRALVPSRICVNRHHTLKLTHKRFTRLPAWLVNYACLRACTIIVASVQFSISHILHTIHVYVRHEIYYILVCNIHMIACNMYMCISCSVCWHMAQCAHIAAGAAQTPYQPQTNIPRTINKNFACMYVHVRKCMQCSESLWLYICVLQCNEIRFIKLSSSFVSISPFGCDADGCTRNASVRAWVLETPRGRRTYANGQRCVASHVVSLSSEMFALRASVVSVV